MFSCLVYPKGIKDNMGEITPWYPTGEPVRKTQNPPLILPRRITLKNLSENEGFSSEYSGWDYLPFSAPDSVNLGDIFQ